MIRFMIRNWFALRCLNSIQVAIAMAAIFGFTILGFQTAAAQVADQPGTRETKWWKGNLHTHSFWSDGNDFPEMIARWYKEHGYHFLALTDHNVLSRGERWMKLDAITTRGGDQVVQKYIDAFGETWVERRQNDMEEAEVRLKQLEEFRPRLEQPDQFILIQGEEISDSVAKLPVHLNATNLEDLLRPAGGETVLLAIRNNLRAAQEQQARIGRPILVHLNHPNFGWAVTAEDVAAAIEEQFIEIFNAHPGVNHNGDAQRASLEEIWDIANTLRIAGLNTPPLFGLGTDDSHVYNGRPGPQPGRSWVMVRSDSLQPDSLIRAMYAGDFYASSGVTLSDVKFDVAANRLTVFINGEEGVEFETRFIGTRSGFDSNSTERLDKEGAPIRTTRKYSPEIGAVLSTQTGLQPSYVLTGDELYVRAVITSNRTHPNPSFENQFEQAWTQPVGWTLKESK